MPNRSKSRWSLASERGPGLAPAVDFAGVSGILGVRVCLRQIDSCLWIFCDLHQYNFVVFLGHRYCLRFQNSALKQGLRLISLTRFQFVPLALESPLPLTLTGWQTKLLMRWILLSRVLRGFGGRRFGLLSQTNSARGCRFIEHSCQRPAIIARKRKSPTAGRFSDGFQTHSRIGLLWTTFKRLRPPGDG